MLETFFLFLFRSLLALRYRIHVAGLDTLSPNKRVLFLPNHQALIDPVIIMSVLFPKFHARPLADESQINAPLLAPLLRRVNPITLPDLTKNGKSAQQATLEAIESVVQALNHDENILFYPSGHITRTRNEKVAANSGVTMILDGVSDLQIVLVRITGLWGSSFGWGSGTAPHLFGKIGFYLKCLAANLLLFVPKRDVRIEFVHDTSLANLSNKKEINQYLEAFYNQNTAANTHVPYFFWQGTTPVTVPEPSFKTNSTELGSVPQETQKLVFAHLQQMTGIDSIHLSDTLSADLGLDSLSQVDLGHWLTGEFGVALESMEGIDTVGSVVLAASGQALGTQTIAAKPISSKWFANPSSAAIPVPTGKTVTENFLQHAKNKPDAVFLADQLAGTKTWRNVITAIYALRPEIQKIDSEYVGIMLPASVSATIVYLTLLFSGKIPVMINWTVGEANLKHSLTTVDLKHILTASALMEKLKQQGNDFSTLPVEWIELDKLAATLPKTQKLLALFKSYFSWKALYTQPIQNTAAVLFTSGSESKPKTVPLTHENFLANMEDYNRFFTFLESDRILGMLPPFHSFGLAGGMILPLCMGIRVVYHANPTEGVVLSQLIARYSPSITFGTPTFINGILVGSRKGELQSLRLLVTGAEKCPQALYNAFSQHYPNTSMIEGYGITECSPVVSANRLENPKPGTIGQVLPSLEYLIVDPDTFLPVEQPCRGRLLVRGRSVFSGYLNHDGPSPFVKVNDKEWYDTGDLVIEDNEKTLTFAGRLKRFIKIGGEMISLPAIEDALARAFTAINEQGEPLFAVDSTASDIHPEILLFSANPIERQLANETLKKAGLSPLHNIRRVVQVKTIPLLGSGKTDYQALKHSEEAQ